MERRDWSLKALNELTYIDSLTEEEKAQGLQSWATTYLTNHNISEFDLELDELKKLSELFFKNINFLHIHREHIREKLINIQKMKKFLNN